jgi:hypothetical protein
MRSHSQRRGVLCSFCHKSLRNDRIDVMGFRLHILCANDVASVLDKVRAFNLWKRAHGHGKPFELTV